MGFMSLTMVVQKLKREQKYEDKKEMKINRI